MERLEITAEIQAARARFQGAQSDFNALLGRPSDLEVQLPEGRTDLQPDTGLMQAEETDWTGHPEVLRQTLLGEAGELAVERARLAGRPMLGVGAEIMGSNYLMGMTGRVPVVASVRLQLPVWRKPVRARIEQARAETRSNGPSSGRRTTTASGATTQLPCPPTGKPMPGWNYTAPSWSPAAGN